MGEFLFTAAKGQIERIAIRASIRIHNHTFFFMQKRKTAVAKGSSVPGTILALAEEKIKLEEIKLSAGRQKKGGILGDQENSIKEKLKLLKVLSLRWINQYQYSMR